MGLLTPSPGEVQDRLSILHLKITHAKDLVVKENFEREVRELTLYITWKWNGRLSANKGIESKFKSDALAEDLYKINSQLWDLEDERRRLINVYSSGLYDHLGVLIVENAVRTTELNDQRSKYISEINKLYGLEVVEKLYKQ